MLSAIIIDDEENARFFLAEQLRLYCSNIKLVAEAENVKSGIQVIKKFSPEVVFLDIKLTDGSGFDLIEQLAKEQEGVGSLDFRIIFTTAYDEFAVKAFRFSALDYLLKPIDPNELVNAVKKIETSPFQKNTSESFDVLFENIKELSSENKKVVLYTSEGIYIYKINEIIRCESHSNYTKFYLKNNKPILVSKTLKEFDNMLQEHGFERVHKSHLINVNYLKMYVHKDDAIIMDDGTKIPVSFRKKERLLTLLKSL